MVCRNQAVGIENISAAQTVVTAATIKWILKDGVGALGQLLIGGQNRNIDFDKDPQRWRMYAEFLTLAGIYTDKSFFSVIYTNCDINI